MGKATILMYPLPSVPEKGVEYPCADSDRCARCPTRLSHYNMGVLCSPCHRQVTEEMNGADVGVDIQPYKELLRRRRPHNRHFVPSPAAHSGLLAETSLPFACTMRHHPQEGHR